MDITIHASFLPPDQPGINLATAELDGTFERLQASDAEVVQKPTEVKGLGLVRRKEVLRNG